MSGPVGDRHILPTNRPPIRRTILGSIRRPRRSPVPAQLQASIDDALEIVRAAQADLEAVIDKSGPLELRREAHRRLRAAFDTADTLLREAVSLTLSDDLATWSHWRARLSALDRARQEHLLAEMDDSGALAPGSVRVVDYGMSGPDIGDLQHGRSRPAGTPARIGLDQSVMLRRPVPAAQRRFAAHPREDGATQIAIEEESR